jgi:hypothetical protein
MAGYMVEPQVVGAVRGGGAGRPMCALLVHSGRGEVPTPLAKNGEMIPARRQEVPISAKMYQRR